MIQFGAILKPVPVKTGKPNAAGVKPFVFRQGYPPAHHDFFRLLEPPITPETDVSTMRLWQFYDKSGQPYVVTNPHTDDYFNQISVQDPALTALGQQNSQAIQKIIESFDPEKLADINSPETAELKRQLKPFHDQWNKKYDEVATKHWTDLLLKDPELAPLELQSLELAKQIDAETDSAGKKTLQEQREKIRTQIADINIARFLKRNANQIEERPYLVRTGGLMELVDWFAGLTSKLFGGTRS
jgi:hypothetical protein